MLDLADLHRNAQAPQFGSYGARHVRYGKASPRGSPPKRRTVLSVHDWAVDAVRSTSTALTLVRILRWG